MIRLLHVISDTNIGGAGMQMLGLLGGLDRSEFSIKAVLPKGSQLAPRLAQLGVEYEEIEHLAERSFSAKAVLPLFGIIKSFKPHVVHAHAAMSARVAARLWGKCKIVNTRHSVFPPTKRQARLRLAAGALESFLGDAVIAVSESAKANLAQLGIRENKIVVIPNGIDPSAFKFDSQARRSAREELGIADDVFCMGHVGRFGPEKNQAFLLEILGNVKAERKSALVLVGDGELLCKTKALAQEAGLGEDVLFLGARSDACRWYQAFDIFLMPSASEGFGLVAVEAQCAGLACILSSHVPHEVKCSEAALFLPLGSARKWADACLSLESRNRDEGFLNVAKSGLDAKTMCEKSAEIYRSLAKSN